MRQRLTKAGQRELIRSFLASHGCRPPAGLVEQMYLSFPRENEPLLKKGDHIRHVFIILSGQFTVSELWSNGNIFIFTELGPEDFICEMECYQNIQSA